MMKDTNMEPIKQILVEIRNIDLAIKANPMEIGNLIIRFQLQRRLTQLEKELGFNPSFDM